MGGTAHPLGAPDGDYFFVDLREVGSNLNSAGYKTMRGQSALNVAFRASTSICRSLVGKEDAPNLSYDLALFLLATLEGDAVKGENLEEGIQEIKEKTREMADDVDGDPYSELAKESFAIVEDEGDSESN